MRIISSGRWLARLFRLALGALAIWLVLSLLAWLSAPPLIRWWVESRVSAQIGRDVRIGAVAFDPWRLKLVIDDLKVAAAAGSRAADSRPLLAIRRLDVDLAASSLWERAPVIEALTITTVRLRIARLAVGHYDIDDLLVRLAGPETEKPGSTSSFRFALYNAQLHDAALRFDDRPAGHVQELTSLELVLPFLSNLPAKLDVKVAPRLAFRLNGVAFDSSAIATPFSARHAGAVKFAVRSLDLAPYLDYLPSTLPVRLESGVLSTDLALDFSTPAGGVPSFQVQGAVALEQVRLSETNGVQFASWRKADIAIRTAEMFSRRVALASARIEGADVRLRRAADGTVWLPGSGITLAVTPTDAPVPARSASSPTPAPAWQVELDHVELADAAVSWNDAAVVPAVALRLSGLSIAADRLHWPLREPIELTARASLGSPTDKAAAGGAVAIQGSVSTTSASLQASVQDLPLTPLAGYVAQALTPKLAGRASARARIDWVASSGTRVVLDAAVFDSLALAGGLSSEAGPRPPASVKRLALEGVEVDIPARGVKIGKLSVDDPSLTLVRGADGLLDATRWFVASPMPPSAGSSGSAPARPWRVQIAKTVLSGGRVQWTDASQPARGASDPVRFDIADLRVDLQSWTWQGAAAMVPAHFEASGRVGLPLAPGEPASRLPGTFEWQGVVGAAPLQVIGKLKTERLPVHLLMPYFGNSLPVRVARLELGIDGQLSVRQRPTGLDIDAGADVLLGAVRIEAASKVASNEALVSWNTLGLKGVQVAVKPGARPRIEVAEAAMTNFYSRLVVTEQGRLNVSTLSATPSAPVPAAGARPASGGLPIDLRIGVTTFANGRVDFSDRFVRPNYSAALTELSGRLGALDSARPAMTPLNLRGKAAGTAQLEVDGSIDPLGQPPALELRAKATDLELAPLSPYAGKYAGYAIKRGKLSMDLAYRLGADGRLDATNRVVLNQLAFGDRIESPAATSLPVLLAVTLLKDRNGVIDLDLPIRGSVNDPQFSVAAIIGRLLVNLLAKAITSPFSLLARGAGSDESAGDPAHVEFLPGTAQLAPAGAAAVDTVAQALVGKPGLLLTVTGTADTAREQDAYRAATLAERIAAARRKATVASAADAGTALPPLTQEDRQRLLRQIYRETDLADKPRNVFGFATEVPAAEMEARLKAAIEVDADTVRALALQRGVGVRDAFMAKGLPSDRLFLAAPRVDGEGATAPEALLALTPR